MLRTVNFTGRTGHFDVPSFLLTENENLEIYFNAQVAKQGVFVATIKHGSAVRTVKLDEDKTVLITPEWLKENGEKPLEILFEMRTLDMSRVIIPNASESGGYFIEPLQILKTDDTYTAIGWLTKIENALLSHTQEIEELQTAVEDMHDKIEKAKNEAIVTATGGDVLNG